jgi:hypothetical protein
VVLILPMIRAPVRPLLVKTVVRVRFRLDLRPPVSCMERMPSRLMTCRPPPCSPKDSLAAEIILVMVEAMPPWFLGAPLLPQLRMLGWRQPPWLSFLPHKESRPRLFPRRRSPWPQS